MMISASMQHQIRSGRAMAAACILMAAQLSAASAQPMAAEPGDIVLGLSEAPVTVIEYTSLNCVHCKAFHQSVWPRVKAELIDKGHIRYVLRNVPLDEIGMAATLVALCRNKDEHLEAVGRFYQDSSEWWAAARPLPALRTVAMRLGIDNVQFETCVRNSKAFEALKKARSDATAAGIVSVPTFVVGQNRHAGAATFEEIQRMIAQINRPRP